MYTAARLVSTGRAAVFLRAELPQSKPDGFASSLGEGAFGMVAQFPAQAQSLRACPLPLGGAVAQRLRGFKSAKPEKTVKRSSRRTGVNLQFFPVEPSSLGLKGASSPFFVAPARRNRWHFSGSLLVSKENIPGKQKLSRRAAVFSLLHLLCQKGRCHCNRLALGILRAGGAVLGQQTHRAGHVPARQYRRGA